MEHANNSSLQHRWISCRMVRWLIGNVLILLKKLVGLTYQVFQHRLARLVLYLLVAILVLRSATRSFTKRWVEEQYLMPENRLSGVKRRYAICFYGTHTSLEHVLPSTVCNVLKPITDAGDTYDVFVHTFEDDVPGEDEQQHSNNSSANEIIMKLKPVRSLVTSFKDFQATFLSNPDSNITLSYYDSIDTGMEVLRDQHSLSRLWEIMAKKKSEGADYDGVISLRLDAMCLKEVDIQKKNIPPGRIYFPSYLGTNATTGNDNNKAVNSYYKSRFAYGEYEVMREYMNRDLNVMITTHDPIVMHHVTAEKSRLRGGISKRGKINVKYSQVPVIRLLTSGIVSPDDVKIWKRFLSIHCSEKLSTLPEACEKFAPDGASTNASKVFAMNCTSLSDYTEMVNKLQ